MSTPSVIESRDEARLLARPAPRRRRRVGAAAARRRLAWALIAPAALFMVLVHGLPTVGGIYLSFKELNTFTFAMLFDAPSAGVSNYSAIVFDADSPLRPGFFGAVQNTAVYTFFTVGGTLAGGLAVAVLLNRPIRGQKLIRTLMLTPWIVPSFVVALLWQFMWQSDVGIVNKILVDYLGILGERPVWLSGEASLWAIIIPSIWRGLPFAMLIFFAGLQAIPKELGEAAAIDGAGPWRR
ncbi:MAG TPA: sugar ABC transporter permease, partial [Solirubrobacteraceae bacterium]|nr:sugar ABC transporter permease [Solirubrobacteraceae bacterium]